MSVPMTALSPVAGLTEAQRKLARHALGLDNSFLGKSKRSYRNRYVTGLGVDDHPVWYPMVQAGLAMHSRGTYYLTRAGAELALEPGETLCPEDFPPDDAKDI